MKIRRGLFERRSTETHIKASVTIDGNGKTKIKTKIGFLDHMLDLFAFHGLFDIQIESKKADLNVDSHHTNEDVALVLGQTFKKALSEKKGIRRFGSAFAPMESTLGHSVVDISGRGYLYLQIGDPQIVKETIKEKEGYSISYLEHFWETFAKNIGATIHIRILNPSEDLHTNVETVFKSLGLALNQAAQIDPQRKGNIPSTKGIID